MIRHRPPTAAEAEANAARQPDSGNNSGARHGVELDRIEDDQITVSDVEPANDAIRIIAAQPTNRRLLAFGGRLSYGPVRRSAMYRAYVRAYLRIRRAVSGMGSARCVVFTVRKIKVKSASGGPAQTPLFNRTWVLSWENGSG